VPTATERGNPASENCVANNGKHVVETNPAGGEFGICLFEDNRQCEEWALLRAECPKGGIKVTGFVTPAARYCGITGGQYSVTENSGGANEKGICTLPRNRVCNADEYFRKGSACSTKAQVDFDALRRSRTFPGQDAVARRATFPPFPWPAVFPSSKTRSHRRPALTQGA
jgi:putative hemolysin